MSSLPRPWLNTPLFIEILNSYIFHAEECWDATFSWFLETVIANIFPGNQAGLWESRQSGVPF